MASWSGKTIEWKTDNELGAKYGQCSPDEKKAENLRKEERMNPRQRWRCALEHRESDRVPIHDSPWDATVDRWRKEGLPPSISASDYFGYEMVRFCPDVGPQLGCEVLEEDEEYIVQRNHFGEVVKNHRNRSTTPQIIDSPIKNRTDWEKIRSRLIASDSRSVSSGNTMNPDGYVSMEEALTKFGRERRKGRFITFTAPVGYGLLQRYLGSERLLVAIATDPLWVKEMYTTAAQLAVDMCEVMIDKGFEFDGAFLSDDLGYRNGLLFSPKCYQEQLLPADKLICDYFHSKDMPVILHSCGCVKELIPHLIEAGFSCLQPLEVKAGMDVRELKRKYGDKLSFMGGIDVRLMRADDPNLIEKEIKEKFSVAKKGGGYIYHSDHSIPNDVSFEQYRRVMELVRQYGRYDKEANG